MQHCGVNANADVGASRFDLLQGRARRECAVGDHGHGQATSPPSVTYVRAKLTQDAAYCRRGVVRCGHLITSHYQFSVYVARRLQTVQPLADGREGSTARRGIEKGDNCTINRGQVLAAENPRDFPSFRKGKPKIIRCQPRIRTPCPDQWPHSASRATGGGVRERWAACGQGSSSA